MAPPRRPALQGALVLAAVVANAAPVLAAAPAPAARAYILVNPDTGETLAARNPDVQLPMASTTKMMTALVVVARAELDDELTVPPAAARVGESSAQLVAGERLRVRDLLTGLLIGSGNDAAETLAVGVGGGERRFVAMMNARARALGLRHTHFANPHGLDAPGHYSTVRDLVTIGRALMAVPVLRGTVRRRRATIPGPGGVGARPLESKNSLLDILPEADGIKTGDTEGAGYALVAHARRPGLGVQLYAAVIGAPSEERRARDMRRLLLWGFRRYARAELVPAGATFGAVPVRGRDGVTVPLRAAGPPLRVPVRIGRPVRASVIAPADVVGPVREGQPLGRVVVRQGDVELGERPLVAGASADGTGGWDRVRELVGALTP